MLTIPLHVCIRRIHRYNRERSTVCEERRWPLQLMQKRACCDSCEPALQGLQCYIDACLAAICSLVIFHSFSIASRSDTILLGSVILQSTK